MYDTNSIDLNNNTITLSEPWSYGEVEKGTKLSQSNAGASFNYGIMASNRNVTEQYKIYSSTIQGTNNRGTVTATKFRAGTKYIKYGMIINLHEPRYDTITDIKGIIFIEID